VRTPVAAHGVSGLGVSGVSGVSGVVVIGGDVDSVALMSGSGVALGAGSAVVLSGTGVISALRALLCVAGTVRGSDGLRGVRTATSGAATLGTGSETLSGRARTTDGAVRLGAGAT